MWKPLLFCKSRRSAEEACSRRLANNDASFVITHAPEPQDILWNDLCINDERKTVDEIIGIALIVGLFFAFMPIVIGISRVTSLHNLEKIGFIKKLIDISGKKTMVAGLCASLGLTLMMSMLPTFLMWIYYGFFTLNGNRWAQLLLQKMYFWFLVVFVLLTTAVGANLAETLEKLAKSPFSIFTLLSSRMPFTTHFYMNYAVMQQFTHGMNLTRYMNLIKFWAFKRMYGDEEVARAASEPEDQDYYGIGSRSARFTFMLLMGIVFGTICPLMNLCVLWNFVVCRIVYGYLIPCAEMRKADLGGDHWVQQLKHISEAMLIYIVLMTGILVHRAESKVPAGIAATAFLFWAISYYRFRHIFIWESLAWEDVVRKAPKLEFKRTSALPDYSRPIMESDTSKW